MDKEERGRGMLEGSGGEWLRERGGLLASEVMGKGMELERDLWGGGGVGEGWVEEEWKGGAGGKV